MKRERRGPQSRAATHQEMRVLGPKDARGLFSVRSEMGASCCWETQKLALAAVRALGPERPQAPVLARA